MREQSFPLFLRSMTKGTTEWFMLGVATDTQDFTPAPLLCRKDPEGLEKRENIEGGL